MEVNLDPTTLLGYMGVWLVAFEVVNLAAVSLPLCSCRLFCLLENQRAFSQPSLTPPRTFSAGKGRTHPPPPLTAINGFDIRDFDKMYFLETQMSLD